MQKRIKFRCWNCKRKYRLNKNLDPHKYQVIRQPCPYCDEINNLAFNKHLKTADSTMKSIDPNPNDITYLDFEQVFDTEPDDQE
jgi:hypothetical protein